MLASFTIIDREEKADCLTLFVYPVSYNCYCSVALSYGDVCVVIIFPNHSLFTCFLHVFPLIFETTNGVPLFSPGKLKQ